MSDSEESSSSEYEEDSMEESSFSSSSSGSAMDINDSDEFGGGSSESEDELLPFDPESANTTNLFHYFAEFSSCDLVKAIFAHDVTKVKELLKVGEGVNVVDNNGNTLLHMVLIANDDEILEAVLKENKTKLNAVNLLGQTPLLYGIQSEKPHRLILRLIEAGCDINIANMEKETPLHLAARLGNVIVGEALIKGGADVNATDYCGYTPLHEAVTKAQLEFVQMLLYYGADATIKCDHGLTPFMKAVNDPQDRGIAFELLEYEVDLNNVTDDGFSTLFMALNSFHPIAFELIERGANVNWVSSDDYTSLELSLLWEDARIFRAIWPRLDKKLLISPTKQFLNVFFSKCNYRGEGWLESLFTLINSDVSSELVRSYVFHVDLFLILARVFTVKAVASNDRLRVINKFLELGAPVSLSGFVEMYERFHCGKEVDTLLIANIPNEFIDVVMPKLIVYIKQDPNSVIRKFLKRPVYDVTLFLEEFSKILMYVMPMKSLKSLCFKKLHKLSKTVTRSRNGENKRLHETVLNRLLDANGVPSLLELARNATRVFIRNNCKGRNSAEHHLFLNRLPLPERLKNIVKFKIPLYPL